jgi:hypothetical protein
MKTIITADFYSPRWGHADTYTFLMEREYMKISMGAREAKCLWRENLEPIWEGEPFHKILKNDSIYPPTIVLDFVVHIWESLRSDKINPVEADSELQAVVTWVNETTKGRPKSNFWKECF